MHNDRFPRTAHDRDCPQRALASFEVEMGVFYSKHCCFTKKSESLERQKVLFRDRSSGTARFRNLVHMIACAISRVSSFNKNKRFHRAPIDGINLCCHLSACFPSRTPDASTPAHFAESSPSLHQWRLRCKLPPQASSSVRGLNHKSVFSRFKFMYYFYP